MHADWSVPVEAELHADPDHRRAAAPWLVRTDVRILD
jgi:hypothetical protein